MKKYFTLAALVFGMFSFAQEAGKAGELLRNEASSAEMRTQQKSMGTLGNTEAQKRGVFVTPNGMRGQNNTTTKHPQYRWNQNFGYSEVFLRIPEGGYFTVQIGDQQISNATGKFRFFDLGSGSMPISIYEGNYLLYRTRLNVRNNSRMILDFFTMEGLYLLDTVPVHNQTYGFNQWDDVWNSPYNGGTFNNGYGNSGYYGNANVMTNANFQRFMNMLMTKGTDNAKMQLISTQATHSAFSAVQIHEMMSVMVMEYRKLEIAKKLYAKCVDRQNYAVVFSALVSNRSKQELQRYISGR